MRLSGLRTRAWRDIGLLLGLAWLLVSCSDGGQSGSISPSPDRLPSFERQAVDNLLDLYRTAILQEDIDRLQEILQGANQPAPTCPADGDMTAAQFLNCMSANFRRRAYTAVTIGQPTMQLAAEPYTVTFQETVSFEALSADTPPLPEQRTLVQQTMLTLHREEESGLVTIRIAAVRHMGPTIQIMTPGQVVAQQPARVFVSDISGMVSLTGGSVTVPDSVERQSLMAANGFLHGLFTPPDEAEPQPLRLRVREANGTEITVRHHYRLRRTGDGVVQRLRFPEIDVTREFDVAQFSALALGANDTVWVGGEADNINHPMALGTLLHLNTEGRSVDDILPLTHEDFDIAAGNRYRITDLTVDQPGRVQFLFVEESRDPAAERPIVGGGVVVLDPPRLDRETETLFCRTVTSFSPEEYPFRDNTGEASASTRLRAARAGNIWLYGSDGGIAQVTDGFRNGRCPDTRVEVEYGPIFRRQDTPNGPPGILANTIPAFVEASNGALWFGTALGVTRLLEGQFTPVPFDTGLSFRGNPTTLETFFQALARAIFEARPLTTVALGGVSFVDTFDAPVVKADLSFSMVEDRQHHIWVGTLGGGLRRIEAQGATDTLHQTRTEGLSSNIIFALAVGPDGALWATTDEGVSRLQLVGERVILTTFSTLDGLPTLPDGLAQPIRDVVVDRHHQVWLATDDGLLRILPQGGQVQGVLLDTAANPVVGADVTVLGTPFRAITDAAGRFVLDHLPPGDHTLRVDSDLAVGGAVASVDADVAVIAGAQVDIALRVGERQLRRVRGNNQSGIVGQPLRLPLVVQVVDAADAGEANIPINFAASSGVLSPPETVSDEAGFAETRLTLGRQAGEVTVTATAPRVDPETTPSFMITALPERNSARLIRVAGNNQSAPPGGALRRPLVLRLEDQFGNRLQAEPVATAVQQGQGDLVAVPLSMQDCTNAMFNDRNSAQDMTNEQGEVAFCLRTEANSDQDIVVQATAPEIEEVEPVLFVAIVGDIDLIGQPRDLAVAGDVVYIVTEAGGDCGPTIEPTRLQLIDVSDPRQPRELDSNNLNSDLDGAPANVAVAEPFAYVVTQSLSTDSVLIFYTLNVSQPASPRIMGCLKPPGLPTAALCSENATLRSVGRPQKLVVHDHLAYLLLEGTDATAGALLVFDIANPEAPNIIGAAALGTILDITDPRRPLLVPSVDRIDNSDVRLRRIEGNRQLVAPGQILGHDARVGFPSQILNPLRIQVEDRLREPLGNVEVTAEVIRGEGRFVIPGDDSCAGLTAQRQTADTLTIRTGAIGEACFFLQAGPGEGDIVVQITAFERTVQFVTLVALSETGNSFSGGTVNLLGGERSVERGLAVVDNVVYIPSSLDDPRGDVGLLHLIDVSDPTQPVEREAVFAPLCPSRPVTIPTFGTGDTAETGRIPFCTEFLGIFGTDQTLHMVENEGVPATQECDAQQVRQFLALDVSNPVIPTPAPAVRLPTVPSQSGAAALTVIDDFAYVVSFTLGLQVVDVGDRNNPRFVGSVDAPSMALNVTAARQGSQTFVYLTDATVGLNVVAGPPENPEDSDEDGVIDFFDAFAIDGNEALDTDRDGVGDNADDDDDGDDFLDVEELAQRGECTDPLSPIDFPICPSSPCPVVQGQENITFVDPAAPPRGNGALETPFRSINVALRALQRLTVAATVVVREGTYSPRLTGEIVPLPLSKDTLRGSGRDNTIINAEFLANVASLGASTTIEDLTISGGVNGINAGGGDLIPTTIRRNRITGNLVSGLALGGSGTFSVTDNEVINNCFRGLEVFGGAAADISGNIVQGNREDGITLFNASSIADPLQGSRGIDNNIITENGEDGIQIAQRSQATIFNNDIRDNAAFGLVISDASTVDSLRDNVIMANAQSGISAQTGSEVFILENIITDNGLSTGQHGILVTSGANATIVDNDIIANGNQDDLGAGIVVTNSKSNAAIVGNVLRDNGFGIVVLGGANADITGRNVVEEHHARGIWVDNGANATLEDTTIRNNREDGIRVTRDSTVLLTSNLIRANGLDTGQPGVAVLSGSTALVLANEIARNAFGIAQADLGTNATVLQNVIADNVLSGAIVIDGASGLLFDNTITRNGLGTGQSGLFVSNATVSLGGGSISASGADGVLLAAGAFAAVACEGSQLTIASNANNGIAIASGATAEINVANILFMDNGGEEIAGQFLTPCAGLLLAP